MPDSTHHKKQALIRNMAGEVIDLYDLDITKITLDDIAIPLANTNRYNGRYDGFFSVNVAFHSVCVAKRAYELAFERGVHLSPYVRIMFASTASMRAILHDASEGFLADMITPVKVNLPDYAELEAKVQDRIHAWGDVQYVSEEIKEIVAQADAEILYMEMKQLGKDMISPERQARVASDPPLFQYMRMTRWPTPEESYYLFRDRFYDTLDVISQFSSQEEKAL